MRLLGTLYATLYVLMIIVIFVLPSFSFDGYSITRNSLSELGAQATPKNWVINIVFIALSLVTALLATKVLRKYWVPLYLMYFFAGSFFFTAIFQHAPISSGAYLESEHLKHIVFSTFAGTAFCVYCFIIYLKLQKPIERASAILMGCLAIGLSLLMFNFEAYKGIFQRVLFITAFGWLFISLTTFTFSKPLKKT